MTEMHSSDGETIPFCEVLYPKGNVEQWMLEVERVMSESVKDTIKRALDDYFVTERTDWVLSWAGQVRYLKI